MRYVAPVAAALAALAAGSIPLTGQSAPADAASRLHADAIVIDTHVDTTSLLLRPGWRFDQRHQPPTAEGRPGNAIDLPRMREGGLDAAFFAVYVPGTLTGPAAVTAARQQFDAIRATVETNPADLALCRSASDIRAAAAEGKIGILIGVEGGHMIDNDLTKLDDFARLGASYLTLTHMVNVGWADSSGDTPASKGLTAFGRKVVEELNRLGMLVDVSHVSDRTFADVLAVTQAPVIASHSACRAICGHPRNLTDEMIKALAAGGGVIEINFMDGFIDQAVYLEQARREPIERALRAKLEQQFPGQANAERRTLEFRAAISPPPSVSWERIVDHIDHVVRLVGPDYVGLGSDFDGASMPIGMEDCTGLPQITRAMVARGYKSSDIRKILGGNTLRVMERAEQVGRRLSRQ